MSIELEEIEVSARLAIAQFLGVSSQDAADWRPVPLAEGFSLEAKLSTEYLYLKWHRDLDISFRLFQQIFPDQAITKCLGVASETLLEIERPDSEKKRSTEVHRHRFSYASFVNVSVDLVHFRRAPETQKMGIMQGVMSLARSGKGWKLDPKCPYHSFSAIMAVPHAENRTRIWVFRREPFPLMEIPVDCHLRIALSWTALFIFRLERFVVSPIMMIKHDGGSEQAELASLLGGCDAVQGLVELESSSETSTIEIFGDAIQLHFATGVSFRDKTAALRLAESVIMQVLNQRLEIEMALLDIVNGGGLKRKPLKLTLSATRAVLQDWAHRAEKLYQPRLNHAARRGSLHTSSTDAFGVLSGSNDLDVKPRLQYTPHSSPFRSMETSAPNHPAVHIPAASSPPSAGVPASAGVTPSSTLAAASTSSSSASASAATSTSASGANDISRYRSLATAPAQLTLPAAPISLSCPASPAAEHQSSAQASGMVVGGDGKPLVPPPNAFILFCAEWRRPMTEQLRDTHRSVQVTQELAKIWRSMSETEKQKYFHKAKIVKEQFERQHPGVRFRRAKRRKRDGEPHADSKRPSPNPIGNEGGSRGGHADRDRDGHSPHSDFDSDSDSDERGKGRAGERAKGPRPSPTVGPSGDEGRRDTSSWLRSAAPDPTVGLESRARDDSAAVRFDASLPYAPSGRPQRDHNGNGVPDLPPGAGGLARTMSAPVPVTSRPLGLLDYLSFDDHLPVTTRDPSDSPTYRFPHEPANYRDPAAPRPSSSQPSPDATAYRPSPSDRPTALPSLRSNGPDPQRWPVLEPTPPVPRGYRDDWDAPAIATSSTFFRDPRLPPAYYSQAYLEQSSLSRSSNARGSDGAKSSTDLAEFLSGKGEYLSSSGDLLRESRDPKESQTRDARESRERAEVGQSLRREWEAKTRDGRGSRPREYEPRDREGEGEREQSRDRARDWEREQYEDRHASTSRAPPTASDSRNHDSSRHALDTYSAHLSRSPDDHPHPPKPTSDPSASTPASYPAASLTPPHPPVGSSTPKSTNNATSRSPSLAPNATPSAALVHSPASPQNHLSPVTAHPLPPLKAEL